MKRQDVKHGVEYAVRVGSYGGFSRILIIGEMTRERPGRWSHSPPTKERGLEGRVIEGLYRLGFGSSMIEKGGVGFVRPRDVCHEWTVQAAQQENDARLKAERERLKAEDEAERLDLDRRMVALGVNSGLTLDPERFGYTGPSTQLAINRQALKALIERAEA